MPSRAEMMKFAVIQFPGSNCDQDCLAALARTGRRGGGVRLAQGNVARGFRRDRFAGRIFLRRLSSLRRHRAFFADHAARWWRRRARACSSSGFAMAFKFCAKRACSRARWCAIAAPHFVCEMVTTAGGGRALAVHARLSGRNAPADAGGARRGLFFCGRGDVARTERRTGR